MQNLGYERLRSLMVQRAKIVDRITFLEQWSSWDATLETQKLEELLKKLNEKIKALV